MDSMVKFSAVASACCIYTPLDTGQGQRTTTGWHNAGGQLISPGGFSTTQVNLGGGGNPL
jgi:hypothetical protein